MTSQAIFLYISHLTILKYFVPQYKRSFFVFHQNNINIPHAVQREIKNHSQQFSRPQIFKKDPPENRAEVLVKSWSKICPLSWPCCSFSQRSGKRLASIYYASIKTRQIWTANWPNANEHFKDIYTVWKKKRRMKERRNKQTSNLRIFNWIE